MWNRLIYIVSFSDGWTGCYMDIEITVSSSTRHKYSVFLNKATTVTHQNLCSHLPFEIPSKLSMLNFYWCGSNVQTAQKSTKVFYLHASCTVLWEFLRWNRLKWSNSGITIGLNANEGALSVNAAILIQNSVRSRPTSIRKLQIAIRVPCQYIVFGTWRCANFLPNHQRQTPMHMMFFLKKRDQKETGKFPSPTQVDL